MTPAVGAAGRPGSGFGNADVVAAVAARLGWDGDAPTPAGPVPHQLDAAGPLDGVRGVVLLLVDGLGWHQLLADGVAAPLLRRAARDQDPVQAALPSTTATNLVSLGTGLAPGAHGVLGYTMVLSHGGEPAVFNPLVWRFGLRGGGFDARTTVVPEALVPGPTLLERLQAEGIAVTVVVNPLHLDSGLTRAGLRGGQRVAARGVEATLDTAVAAVRAGVARRGAALAWAHHPTVDTCGHEDGPFSSSWHAAVAQVDDALGRVVATLPDDLAVVVVADHGMVATPADERTEVADGSPLLDGVRLVAGEPRMRTLVVDDGVDVAPVVRRWRDAMGERAVVESTAVAVAAGWFGPDVPAAHARRLGDVVVASITGAVPHPRVDPRRGRLAGMHGSITDAERDVPALVLRRRG